MTKAEAAELSKNCAVFVIAYLSPVRELTGDQRAIAVELDKTDDAGTTLFTNSAWRFATAKGDQAVVFEYHH